MFKVDKLITSTDQNLTQNVNACFNLYKLLTTMIKRGDMYHQNLYGFWNVTEFL